MSTRYPLARRTAQIDPFHVMELTKRAAALEAAGHPVIHLNIGEPDFTAPEPVVAALERAVRAGHTRYTDATGLAPLREAIARDYGERYGLDIAPSRIVVTAGASAALSLACCALVDPGASVLMTDPGYPCNRHFVTAFDGVPQLVAVGPETRFQLTRGMVEANWRAGTRGALIASPANPTGTSIPFDELGRIVDAVRARGGFTIVDEIYLGLSYDGAPRSALAWGEDLVVTNSFSKYFHMTGWRLGWLVVPEAHAPVFEKLAQNLYICASTLAQHAAIACFDAESLAEYEARRREFQRRRDYIVPALRGAGLPVPVTPDGAFYAYADCSAHSDDSSAFALELLERIHVSVVPGKDFGRHEPSRYLRLSYATSMDRLHEAIARLARYLPARERQRG
ncbi:MAG TPA: pyridoxal phosphate-dependent aminotransferase [Burkholderiaceae bacterium]|jgi:aspartate/methionine/tyrosine aminotransferase|nr:pyridoxal phosphate-dependent aminotransferase [Burkholderiaceae bacterium]